MARRSMSRRGGSASQPQVTPYQQLELDDGWREWENTKQELVLVKRQLGEKDALVLQLKTASRRLQETLRKKDKDLQAAFAILRSPQDAKTTKTRKQELIDRLVSECMQRAATSEALAEERRRELERLKYSSKFLRFQELEIEIEECRTEIERLRAKLDTTASPTAIVGKLKVSAVPRTANTAAGLTNKPKLDALNLTEHEHPGVPASLGPTRAYSTQNAAGQVRVIPLAKLEHREGFVSKTRRRALEAEYYKQVRLAQLEVECELEENLHLRAAREAKKLEAVEQQEHDRHSDRGLDSTRTQLSGSNELTKGGVGEPSDAREGSASADVVSEKPVQQADDTELIHTDTTGQVHHDETSEVKVTQSVEHPGNAESGIEEPQTVKTDEVEVSSAPELILANHKTYEDDEFDASEGEHNEGGEEKSVWNLDPSPQLNPETTKEAINRPDLDSNDNDDTNHVVWNVDPNPPASATTEADLQDESDSERVVWNVDPHVAGPDVPVDRVESAPGDDDVPESKPQLEDSVPSEDHTGSNVWNLDPAAAAPAAEKVSDVVVDDSAQEEEPNNSHGEIKERSPWNLDPTPSTETTGITESLDSPSYAEEEPPVWNLDPEPAATIPSSPNELSARIDVAAAPSEIVEGSEEDEGKIDAVITADTILSSNSPVVGNATRDEHDKSPWNLQPGAPGTTHNSANEEVNSNDDVNDPVQSSAVDQEGPAQSAAVDQDATAGEKGSNNAWNLDPTAPAIDPVDNIQDSQHDAVAVAGSNPLGENENDRLVWNLDPHVGDSNEPINSSATVTVTEFPQEDGDATIPPTMADDREGSSSQDEETSPADESNSTSADESPTHPVENESPAVEQLESDAPEISDDDTQGMVEMLEPSDEAASNHSSARLSDDSPTEDGTPDYTPPSTARDSDAAHEEDASW